MFINKIIAVEGIDKTGKSTFVNNFYNTWNSIPISKYEKLKSYSFPNINNPIGKLIRDDLIKEFPSSDIISITNFMNEFSYFWSHEIYNNNINYYDNHKSNKIIQPKNKNSVNYIFDRYLVSTLAYNVFLENNKYNLDFFKAVLENNEFVKLPTDIIYFDLPNEIIIERTIKDKENGLNDSNDTIDINIINQRRDAFKRSLDFLNKKSEIHYFDNISEYNTDDIIKILLGKIFK